MSIGVERSGKRIAHPSEAVAEPIEDEQRDDPQRQEHEQERGGSREKRGHVGPAEPLDEPLVQWIDEHGDHPAGHDGGHQRPQHPRQQPGGAGTQAEENDEPSLADCL